MRAEYDFSKGRRNPYPTRLRRAQAEHPELDPDLPPLTKAQIRRLDRQTRDIRDKTRYYIEAWILKRHRFVLYYNMTDDMWAMDLTGATFFKRKRTAEAVRALLGDRTRVVRIAKPPKVRRDK